MSSWNPAIPNVANVPANDATAMQLNFKQLNDAFLVDHVTLSQLVPPFGQSGEHKQISFNNVGSNPYSVVTGQSYEYARFLFSPGSVRTFLEYQPAGGEVFAASPAIVPLSFKAYVVFDPSGVAVGGTVPAGNFKRSFNIASIVRSLTSFSLWTITFNENMPDGFYSSFITFVNSTITSTASIISQANNQVVINANPSFTIITVAVM